MPKLIDAVLHIRALARDVHVTGIFTEVAAANAHMEENPNEGVIAEDGGLIFIADVRHLGIPR